MERREWGRIEGQKLFKLRKSSKILKIFKKNPKKSKKNPKK